jgi:trehalose-phosphatase
MPDLARRLDLDVLLAANHGLEIGGRGLSFQNEQAESRRGVLHRMCGQLARVLTGIPGAWVEDKGLTASVHFRGVEDSRKDEMASLVHSIVAADRDGLEVRKGNQVLEILPRVEWNKGSAVRWILDRRQGVGTAFCYLGDDVTDEDVFRSMEGITIRVGEEGPTAARFEVRNTIEVAVFLRWLGSAPFSARCLKQARDSAGLREPANN